MILDNKSLLILLSNNVCEIKFLRKHQKKGFPNYRRMLCTRAIDNIYNAKLNFLDSEAGRNILGFKKPPKMPIIRPGMTYNWTKKENLLMVWDIFRQDWRCINTAECDLIWAIPANNQFWAVFNRILKNMSAQQKLEFEKK